MEDQPSGRAYSPAFGIGRVTYGFPAELCGVGIYPRKRKLTREERNCRGISTQSDLIPRFLVFRSKDLA
jgi:hypothetical protein